MTGKVTDYYDSNFGEKKLTNMLLATNLHPILFPTLALYMEWVYVKIN